MDRNFPIRPEPTDDPRFTLGLTLEVREVLERHGYPTLGAMDVVDLQQILFRFLYRGVWNGAIAKAARCPRCGRHWYPSMDASYTFPGSTLRQG